MEILQRDDLLLINEMTIERHGGKYTPPENLKNPEAFEYLVSTINEMVFGQEMYPGLEGKAAFYLYKINANHIFGDGNKRTGLEAALLFLKLNGFELKYKLVAIQKANQVFMPKNKDADSLELLFNLVMEIADSQHSMEDCTDWFKANITKKTSKSS